MTDHAAIPLDAAAEIDVESHAPYLKVWLGLLVFTVIEYFYARIFMDYFAILIVGLLFCALIKAGMVGWYFMHLKFEGRWVYILIVPTLTLATILTLALTPDMSIKVNATPEPGDEAEPENASALVAPPVIRFAAAFAA